MLGKKYKPLPKKGNKAKAERQFIKPKRPGGPKQPPIKPLKRGR